MTDESLKPPTSGNAGKISRGARQVAGGAIPLVGGFLSAVAGAWSERDQEKVNRFFEHWVQMIQDEIREKEKTVAEVMARLDLQDEKITKRLESEEYQSLIKKTFRDWAGAESEEKRKLIRNILTNAASTDLTSDDVIRMFLTGFRLFRNCTFGSLARYITPAELLAQEYGRKLAKARFGKILPTQTCTSC